MSFDEYLEFLKQYWEIFPLPKIVYKDNLYTQIKI